MICYCCRVKYRIPVLGGGGGKAKTGDGDGVFIFFNGES